MDYSDSMRASLEYFGGEELPAKVFVDKYALRDNNDNFVEATPDDMHNRIASELARIEKKKFKVPYSYDDIYSWIKRFGYICPQGSPMYGIGNPYQSVTLSNCYVIHPPLDSYGGIHKTDEQISQISKRRGGCGTDISFIRPKDTPTKNSSKKSTGIIPFMERFSNSIREVGQDGRRGALMLTINVHHPEVLNFAKIKKDRSKITGANLSISLTNEFLTAVKANKDYEQRWPVEGPKKFSRMVNAREVWKQIIECAWDMAEPGLLFWDKIISESPADCYAKFGFKTVSTNPCCFVDKEDVFVITNNGIKEIKNVTNKDLIWVNETRTWEETSGYFSAGKAQAYKVTFSNNEVLYITNNHKLCVAEPVRNGTVVDYKEGNLVELSNLNIGDKIYIHNTEVEESFKGLGSYEEGLILGAMTGDGCLSYADDSSQYPDTICDFWKDDIQAANRCEKAFHQLGYKISLAICDPKINKQRLSTELFSRDFTNKYQQNIWLFKSDNLNNPFLFNASREFIIGYLRTYFAADGTVSVEHTNSNYAVQIASINKNRLKQVKFLLNLFGIKSSVGLAKPAGTSIIHEVEYKTKDLWRLTISGISNIKNFANKIGIEHTHKSQKLNDICNIEQVRHSKNMQYVTIEAIENYGESNVGCIEVKNVHKFTANGIISGNSELPLSILDSCRLLFLNLFKFVKNPFTKDAYFDFDEFYIFSQRAQRLMDDIVDLELESIDKIIAKLDTDPEPQEVKARELSMWREIRANCYNGRRTGTGITALGDTLAAIGIGYGTKKSIEVTERIYQTLKFGCYRSSVDMAKELGPFPIWNNDLEKDNDFLNRMFKEQIETKNEDLIEITEIENGVEKHFIRGGQIMMEMEVYGRRNIALLTTAPVGSGSMLVELGTLPNGDILHGSSSGVEPAFMLAYTRRKKINPSDKGSKVDFVDQSGDSWQEFPVYHPALKYWMEITGEKDIKKSPWYGYCADDIDWKNRVKLQAAAQRHIDHAISSTINLPEDVPQEKVAEIYEAAWEHGLKGITVYRKNCRSGVLVDLDNKQKDDKMVKRPKELKCDIYHSKVMGTEYFILIGKNNNDLYEIFAGKNGHIPKKYKNGIIQKSGNKYHLILDDENTIKNICSYISSDEESLTRLLSLLLRSNIKLEEILNQLEKTSGNLVDFGKCICRILNKYQKEKNISEKCPECGDYLVFIEGCKKCKSCSFAKCN